MAVVIILTEAGFGCAKNTNQAQENTPKVPQTAEPTPAPAPTPTPAPAPAPAPTPVPPAPTPAPAPTAKGYTLTQVAAHKSSSDCWSAINGKVYDLTDFIYQHPGGARNIISICGIDGSSAFDAQHYGSGKVERELASYLIGDLIK